MNRMSGTAQDSLARALCSALAFESLYKNHVIEEADQDDKSEASLLADARVQGNRLSLASEPRTLNVDAVKANSWVQAKKSNPASDRLMLNIEAVKTVEEDEEDTFFDAVEFLSEEGSYSNSVRVAISRGASPCPSVELIRGGAQNGVLRSQSQSSLSSYGSMRPNSPPSSDSPPPPPAETPLRFIRAGKGDPVVGRQRYEATLAWREENNINGILKEPHPHFELIKQHYPHFFHLQGRNGEKCYYEMPPQTDLKAMRKGGVNLKGLLRHYALVTEFMWQYVDSNDLGKSIYIIDLKGIRMTDFMGECVDFVRQTSSFTGAHYPERSGFIFVLNVPSWFKIIWNVVKPMVDPVTLEKVYILRGEKEIFNALLERIPIENIPPEYGGQSMPLGQAPEENLLWDLMKHNNAQAKGSCDCGGPSGNPACRHCVFVPVRSY